MTLEEKIRQEREIAREEGVWPADVPRRRTRTHQLTGYAMREAEEAAEAERKLLSHVVPSHTTDMLQRRESKCYFGITGTTGTSTAINISSKNALANTHLLTTSPSSVAWSFKERFRHTSFIILGDGNIVLTYSR